MTHDESPLETTPVTSDAARTGPAVEPLDVNVKALLVLTAGLLALVGGSLVLMGGFLSWLSPNGGDPPPLDQPAASTPGRTDVDADQRRQRLAYEARERALLSSYGWVDREEGIARIPIERAMQLFIERRQPEEEEK